MTFEWNDLLQITKSLTLEHFRKGKYVFKIDDIGTKFYVIIKGQVGVYV